MSMKTFLYLNPEYVSIHNEVGDGGMTSASLYDKNNSFSLRNNTADYIFEDSLNSDYVTFVDMVGHHFDNIFVYVNEFTEIKKRENSHMSGMMDSIIKSIHF